MSIQNVGTIAVIVPVYNVEPYIHQCLDSLIAQTYPYWEAYVVDDGSPDNCGRIIDGYAQKDSRFRVFHKSNGGLGSAWNYGLSRIEESSEKYLAVTFLDSDDWVGPEAYADLAPIMSRTGTDVLFFGFKQFYPDRGPEKQIVEKAFSHPAGEVSRLSYMKALYELESWRGKNGVWGLTWNKLFKPSVIKGLRFVEDRGRIEDELFAVEVGLRASHFYFMDKAYHFYRQRAGSAVHSPNFFTKIAHNRLHMLAFVSVSMVTEKEEILRLICHSMFNWFSATYNQRVSEFFLHSNLFAEMARKILPWAVQSHSEGRVSEADLQLLKEMSSSHLDASFQEDAAVQLMLREIESLRREKTDYSKYETLRIDIRNKGEGNSIIEQSVVPMPSRMVRPSWLPGGICLESTAGQMKAVVVCQGDGELDIRLRGRDERDAERKRYPVWIDCTYFSVNGEAVFEETKTICHDRPYIYSKPVKDGEVVELEFRWSECRSGTVLEENRRLQSQLKEIREDRQEAVQRMEGQLEEMGQENRRLSTKVSRLEKDVRRQEKVLVHARTQLGGFRIGTYLKYKVLSKLTLGGMRRRYREKYQEQKRIYQAIRKGRI